MDELLVKITITICGFIIFGLVGGRLFFALAKHFILKYFENQDKKVNAAFKRIDEHRKDFNTFKLTEFREYKRDTALSIKELYDRTDNHDEVRETVKFCNERNKIGV